MRAPLQDGIQHDGTGGLGERGELAQRVLGVLLLALRVHADEDDVLEPQLPVLDLGDVLELGGQPGDAAQRGALLAVPLLAVGVGARDGGLVLERLGRPEYAYPGARFRTREHAIHRVDRHLVGALGDCRIRHVFLPGAPALEPSRRQVEVSVNSSLPRWGRPPVRSKAMGSDHYFSASPASAENLRRIRVTLAERDVEVTTAGGVFSPDHVDSGTGVLLANTPPPPPGGNLLDLGSGWGPIALTLALQSPHATVWAVDVNERALDLVRRNADALGLDEHQRCRCPRMFPTTWSSAPSARIRRSASARTSSTDSSSAGSRGSKSDRMPGSSCSATSARTRSSAGWRDVREGLQRASRRDRPRVPGDQGAPPRLAAERADLASLRPGVGRLRRA